MKYIDVHMHFGDCGVFDLYNTEEQVLEAMNQNGLDAAFWQPCPGARDYKDVHDRVYAMSQKYPGRVYGLASLNPHMPKEQYKKELRHYVKDCGYVGVKIHTLGHAINPLSKDAETVYEAAAELDIPIMIHTGIGVPFASPTFCLPVAKRHPGIKFVLAHAGGQMFAGDALIVAQECENIYLDTTWVGVCDMPGFINGLGSKRLLYASDASTSFENISIEIKKYESLNLSENEYEDIFYKNAISLFKLKNFK